MCFSLKLLTAPLLLAQTPSGTKRGLVFGLQGSAVPSAKITLRAAGGVTERETFTASDRGFTLASVRPGDYEIQVDANGRSST
jgi:hypothetical protein